jgi:hypothetical protein
MAQKDGKRPEHNTDHDSVLPPVIDIDLAQTAEDLLKLEFVEQGDHLDGHL